MKGRIDRTPAPRTHGTENGPGCTGLTGRGSRSDGGREGGTKSALHIPPSAGLAVSR